MIILRSPKGWTGPKSVDGKAPEGTFRSHQVPMADMRHPGHLEILEDWQKNYRPEELFDANGKLNAELAALAPQGGRRGPPPASSATSSTKRLRSSGSIRRRMPTPCSR